VSIYVTFLVCAGTVLVLEEIGLMAPMSPFLALVCALGLSQRVRTLLLVKLMNPCALLLGCFAVDS
jgi:hypothetical protein